MEKAKGFLFDITKCKLCGACWIADKERNKLPIPEGDFTKDKLSENAFLEMDRRHDRGVRFSCMHCLIPTCASVCPVAAFEKTSIGAVIYHKDRCIGCRYCVFGCPFNVPKYEWDKPLPYVRKCDFCYSRIIDGKQPACAQACPTGALIFGNRDDLILEAHRRIRENSNYVDHIYGEHEVGGTSLLLISDISMYKLGYPGNLSDGAVPSLTWEVLEKIPNVVLIGGTFLAGLWWLTNRRNEVMQAESGKKDNSSDTESGSEGGGK